MIKKKREKICTQFWHRFNFHFMHSFREMYLYKTIDTRHLTITLLDRKQTNSALLLVASNRTDGNAHREAYFRPKLHRFVTRPPKLRESGQREEAAPEETLDIMTAQTFHANADESRECAIFVKPHQWPTPSESIAIYCVRKVVSCVTHLQSCAKDDIWKKKKKLRTVAKIKTQDYKIWRLQNLSTVVTPPLNTADKTLSVRSA